VSQDHSGKRFVLLRELGFGVGFLGRKTKGRTRLGGSGSGLIPIPEKPATACVCVGVSFVWSQYASEHIELERKTLEPQQGMSTMVMVSNMMRLPMARRER
jgi:hypothetical protein